jgi:ribosome recycling factor
MSETQKIINSTSDLMDKAIVHLDNELSKIRAGKASAAMLDGIFVDYYGTMTPLSQIANVTSTDARTLTIQPWEKPLLHPIEKAIATSNLGVNPQNDGNIIRLNFPPLTEERRKQLVKQTKDEGEHAKVSVRTIRKESNDQVKKLVKDGVPEDEGKVAETKIQELTDKFVKKVDEVLSAKEKEIMTV